MSTSTKIILAAIVIVLIAVGIWYAVVSMSGPQPVPAASQSVGAANVPAASASTTAPAEGGLTTSSTDTSNTALTQDVNSIDAEMSGLNSDSAAVNQSLQTSNQ